MVTDIPAADWIVTPAEYLDSEQFLIEFDRKQLANGARVAPALESEVIIVSTRAPSLGAIAISSTMAAAFALAAVAVLYLSLRANTQESPDPDTPEEKKKYRLKGCYLILMAIITSAEEALHDGWTSYRALKTDDTESRKQRNYRSRR